MATTMPKTVNGINVETLTNLIGACQAQPELGKSRFRVTNRWLGGTVTRTRIQGFYSAGKEDTSRARPFVLEADEPPLLAGNNTGPNPVEYLLTALVSCVTTAMVAHAAARGIVIEEIESAVEGDIDMRGFMGLADDVPRGYQNIRLAFQIRSDAAPEQLRELAEFSPVYNTVRHPVPVELVISKK